MSLVRSAAMSTKALPSYEAPPLIEVVLGLTFVTLSSVKLPHIGLFWNTIRGAYPRCQQAPTLGNINLVIEPETGVPLPRVWLINQDDDNLIQIQKNKFLFNWRKRENSYPRFGPVSGEFFKYLNKFEEFLSEHELGSIVPTECELTYINHIPKGVGWSTVKDVGKLFPDMKWAQRAGRFLPIPDALNWSASFGLPNEVGSLFVKLNSATRMPDNVPLLILELTARGAATSMSQEDIQQWFETAREWIVLGFEDLVAETVQREHWRKL